MLARDHFGIKPLYYTPLDEGLVFASEIPPLLALPGVRRRANPQRVFDYLRFARTDHGAETMFAGIRQVEPGHYVEVPLDAPHRLDDTEYWSLEPQPVDGLSLDEASQRLRELFLDSVRLHLRSDVPVGAAFSGGVDSSANVAAMRRLSGPGLELHTFSYLADDPVLNEERWVRLVGRETDAVMHTVETSPQELLADLDRLIELQAEPFGGTSIYAQYRVFRLAGEAGIKVMLDGQGADELFAGYRYYLAYRLAGIMARGRLVTVPAGCSAAISNPLPGASPGRNACDGRPATRCPSTRLHLSPRAASPGIGSCPTGSTSNGFGTNTRSRHRRPRPHTRGGSLREYRLDTVRTGLREELLSLRRPELRMASSIESRSAVPHGLGSRRVPRSAHARRLSDRPGRNREARTASWAARPGAGSNPRAPRQGQLRNARGVMASFPRPLGRGGLRERCRTRREPADAPAPGERAKRSWQEMRDGHVRPFGSVVAWRWVNLIRWADRLDVQID